MPSLDIPGIISTQVQDLALHFVEFHEVCTKPTYQACQAPSGWNAFPPANSTTQLGAVSELSEGALDPTVHAAFGKVLSSISPNTYS